jgi:hypothetical protein
VTPTPTVTATPVVACANAEAPACDGECPPGQVCFNSVVVCLCVSGGPGTTVTPTPTPTSVTPTPTVTPTPVCPDGNCGPGESPCNCAADCGPSSCAECGCVFNEGASCNCDISCVDFGDCCPDSCSECVVGVGCCGDGICDGGEDACTNCPQDCPNDPNACEPCECGLSGGGSGCQCDPPACVDFEDCCANAVDVCG